MKLRLPLSLLSAVLLVAAGLTSRAQAVAVPSNYTPHYLADPNDLYDYQSTSGRHAFLLDGSTTFTPSSAPWWTSSQELKENGSILFTIEEDSDPYSLTFKGGANKAFYNVSTLAIEDIGRVTFEGLKESNYDAYSSSYYSSSYYYGGAINATTLRLKSNSRVTFTGNEVIARSGDRRYAYGGAIYGDDGATITISETSGAVTFAQNKATSSFSSASYSYGGAIYGGSSSTISICGNTGDINITDNSSSSSSSSSYYARGGAIYSQGSLYLQNNGNTLIAGNYEKVGSNYRLRSIYMSSTASDGGHFHLSAAAGKSIEFNDSVYVASGTSGQALDVIFNGSYTDADSNSIAQSGDIIFDGANVASTLESIKGSAATEAEISNSRTSYIGGTTHLEAGRLIIRNGAQFNGLGINTTARSGAAVVLQDAGMNHSSGSINLKRGTSLELSGQNAISAQDVTFSGGSTLKFTVDGANRENAVLNLDANLEHFSFTIAVDGAEMLASGRYKLLELASADQYVDVDGYWNADDITVSGTQDAKGASFDNLVWEDGVLYFEQGKSIWSNGSGNDLWDSSSENWQRNGADIRYRNGMDTVFTDEGAGTVQLVGGISPLSISVENSAGNDYRFEASATGGKITGGSAIVKSGSGELALATANEHTGGTLLQEGTLRVQHSTALGAADATVSTAAGTLLSVENGAQVVLSGADNELKGNVSVAAGAGLQVQSSGYAATHTELNGSLSFTAGATGTAAGSLSGSGKLSISGQGTQVSFSRANNFSGSVSLADGAELAVDSISFAQGAVLEVLMDSTSFSVNEMMMLNSVNTVGETPAIVSCTDRLSFDSSYTAGTAVNATAGASLNTTGGLTLQGGSTYTANATHMNLNGGSLSFKDCTVAPINLVLTLDTDELPEEYRIVLFSGVGSVNFDSQALSTVNTSYVFAASDYLSGDYISYTTALIYDSSAQVVYLAEGLAIPEPTTATLSLLALAALAARRRRR